MAVGNDFQTAAGVYPALTAVSAVLTLVSTIAGIALYRRRDLFPIRGRGYRLILVVVFVLNLHHLNVFANALVGDSYPIQFYDMVVAVVYGVSGSAFFIRAFRLLFNFKLTAKALEYNQAYGDPALLRHIADDWFVRHRHYIKPFFLNRLFALNLMIWAAAIVGLEAAVRPYRTTTFTTGTNAVGVVQLLAALALGIQMRSFQEDNWKIKVELRWVFIWICFTFSIWTLVTSITGKIYAEYGFGTWLILCNTAEFVALTVIWPLVISYKIQSATLPTKENYLYGIISTPLGFEAFLAFLTLEFSTENLLFWRDVENIKQAPLETDVLIARINELCDTYIKNGSPSWLNLSGDNRNAVLKMAQEYTSGMEPGLDALWEAQKEIYRLMEKDSFARWELTPEFEQFAKSEAHRGINLLDERVTQLHMQDSHKVQLARDTSTSRSNNSKQPVASPDEVPRISTSVTALPHIAEENAAAIRMPTLAQEPSGQEQLL